MMFILPAPAQRLCFSHIVFVVLTFNLSGSMNTFTDGKPVSWKQSMSFSAPMPKVHPSPKCRTGLLIFFSIFLLFCFSPLVSVCLLRSTVYAQHSFARHLLPPALWLGRPVGTNGCHRVQLVGELFQELLVRGSNPSGVRLLLESVVRGWDPTCPFRAHLSVDTGKHTANKVCISNVL
jgi:hypothetical protein